MTSLTYPQKTVGTHTVHSVPNLDYWRNLVLDYLDDSDDINLYFAAQKLNVLIPEDPVGLYGLACAQRYRGELNTAYFNVIQARRRLAYNSGFPVTYEEALELETVIAVDLGHIATAIDRYGELIELNPLEPNYVSARAKLFDTAENMTVSAHKRRQGQDDSSLTDAQTSLFLRAAEAHAIEFEGKPVFVSYEAALDAAKTLGRIRDIQKASQSLRTRYAELQSAVTYALRRNFVRYQWWQFCLYVLCGMTLPGSVMNNIAKDIAEKGSAGVFSGIFTSIMMISIFTLVGLYFFYPVGHKYNARRVRKRDAKLRAEMLEEPEGISS